MVIAITTISKNGQIVIPSEIRENIGIKPSTKFLVFNKQGNILLKKINEKQLFEDMELLESIERSEQQIKQGKFIQLNTKISDEEIDDLLMK